MQTLIELQIRHKLFASKAIIGAIASLSATPYLHLHHLIYIQIQIQIKENTIMDASIDKNTNT